MLHFQYNGLLSGLLLLSISSLASHSVLLAGLLFSGLLMFKVRMMLELIRTQYVTLQHIYLYIAPAFIVYMFRNYCFKTGEHIQFKKSHALCIAKHKDWKGERLNTHLVTIGGRVIWSSISVTRLVLLGLSVLVNVTAAMAPFILTGERHSDTHFIIKTHCLQIIYPM